MRFDHARMNYLDGIRADFDFGWGLVRLQYNALSRAAL